MSPRNMITNHYHFENFSISFIKLLCSPCSKLPMTLLETPHAGAEAAAQLVAHVPDVCEALGLI